jgi:phosphoglycerol transferase MdoB-like AlkP superfamily enzyme
VRELCGLQLNGIPRSASERAPLGDCLPRALAARGYATSGWHGNSGSFYRRNDIYPAIGLEIVNSYETLRPRVSRLCQFLFVGICDADVLRMAVGSFAKDERAFVHVMTLDTHLPLPPPKGACVDGKNSQLCSWEEGIDRTLESIVQALRRATVKPDLVVLFGDHAPPFLDFDTRSRFVTGQVPFVVLWRQSVQPRLEAVAASSPVKSEVGTGRLVSRR